MDLDHGFDSARPAMYSWLGSSWLAAIHSAGLGRILGLVYNSLGAGLGWFADRWPFEWLGWQNTRLNPAGLGKDSAANSAGLGKNTATLSLAACNLNGRTWLVFRVTRLHSAWICSQHKTVSPTTLQLDIMRGLCRMKKKRARYYEIRPTQSTIPSIHAKTKTLTSKHPRMP